MAETTLENVVDVSKLLPSVRFTKLPSSLLKFPPSPEPLALPPPPDNPNFAHPFTIPADWYNALLDPSVPIAVAIVYATTVTFLNSVNARRKWKPWAFSKTSIFRLIVILHNIILAVYSGWTFLGMLNALQLSIPSWRSENAVSGVVDSLCKMQGPRGLGSAATYSEESRAWAMTNRVFHLAADGLGPERSDVGRLWNEGLAFYGWLFYLSKFYEVIDTAIILAKGKKSSFLQTYHHAGAMLCMWAGIRYMSPPIWMFVFVNSFIHTLMYTFYFCSAVKISVPKRLKRALTSLQITQFVVGASYAFLHLFVKYQIPVSVPYLYHVAPQIASMVASDASSVVSTAIASATADIPTFLKKFALRAAGYEGLAENVGVSSPVASSGSAPQVAQQYLAQAEQRYRDELQWVHCLDTSGQVFAILLNVLYLAPLTWLFARFFIKAYLTQMERRRSSTSSERAHIGKSLSDATHGVGRRLSEAFEEMHKTVDSSSENDSPIVESSESVNTLKQKAAVAAEKTKKATESIRKKATEAAQNAKDNAGDISQKISETQQQIQKKASPAVDDVREKANKVEEKVDEQATKAEHETETVKEEPSEASKVTEDKSFAEAVKEESQSEAEIKDEPTTSPSPNGDGTGAEEVTGQQTDSKQEQLEKKEEEKVIDDSQTLRNEDVKTEDAGVTRSNSNSQQSQIPRPKKNKKKA